MRSRCLARARAPARPPAHPDWSWKDGCEKYDGAACDGSSTLADFAVFVQRTNTTVTWVLNMLTDPGGLTSQLAFLAAAEAVGMPVLFVELGNELCVV